MPITDPEEEGFKDGLWAWNSTAGAWEKVAITSGAINVSCVAAAHAATHKDGGTDELDASELAGALGSANQVLTSDGAACSWAAAAAVVETLCRFTPLHNEPPASNPALLDTRNQHPVLDFDPDTNKSAVFSAVMPRHYTGGGVTVYIHYAMTSAEADTIDWDAAFERIGDQQLDIDGDSFAAIQSINNTTVPGTTGLVDIVAITFTDGAQMDSVAAGEGFRLKITRDAANDDAAEDAELLFVEIKET